MEQTSRNHPPLLLHLLAALFVAAFLLTLSGTLQTIQSWNWLLAAGYFPHPLYVLFKSLLVAILSACAGVVLWLRRFFAPRFSQVCALLVFAWYWFDRLALTRNPLPFRSHLFPLLISVLLLAFVLISAWLLEPYMKRPASAPEGSPGG